MTDVTTTRIKLIDVLELHPGMEWISVMGFAAGTLTTSSFVPQVIKLARTKQTKDVSFWMYVIISIGIGLWLLYGIANGDLPVVMANIISLILVLSVLVLKVRYR